MPGSHQDDTEVKCLVGIVSGGSCALEFEDVEELGVSVGELVEDGEACCCLPNSPPWCAGCPGPPRAPMVPTRPSSL